MFSGTIYSETTTIFFDFIVSNIHGFVNITIYNFLKMGFDPQSGYFSKFFTLE